MDVFKQKLEHVKAKEFEIQVAEVIKIHETVTKILDQLVNIETEVFRIERRKKSLYPHKKRKKRKRNCAIQRMIPIGLYSGQLL